MCRSGRQQKKNIIWIDASEAAVCLKRDLSSLMRKIEKGTFKGKANEAPFDSEGNPNYKEAGTWADRIPMQ